VALLAVNNTRDAKTDEAAGKKTLVVRLGTGFGKAEYVFCLAVSALVPVVMWLTALATPWVMLSWLALPLAVPPLKTLFTQTGAALNLALAGTARLQMIFGVLFAVGLSR
jgi:1,4-dihydroxy-2-naphthoate octaprenyltransferase